MSKNSSPNGQSKYAAFISYRHADNKQDGRQWATWLHQALESYEVPVELIGSINERGERIPDKIFPVFRDEDELAAGSDLAGPILAALTVSQTLVVLCSPQAVKSQYVLDEIIQFKAMGKADRVLAAIIAGSPKVSGPNEDAAYECFPRPLRYEVTKDGKVTSVEANPIASDFRLDDGSEGFTSASAYRAALQEAGNIKRRVMDERVEKFTQRMEQMRLKVIAGILGVRLSRLTERDKAYQLAKAKIKARTQRRWLAGLGSLLVVATMAGVVAWQQAGIATRNADEANKNARQAEANAKQADINASLANMKTQEAAAALSQTELEVASRFVANGEPYNALKPLIRALEASPKNQTAIDLVFGLFSTGELRVPFQWIDSKGMKKFGITDDDHYLDRLCDDGSTLLYHGGMINLETKDYALKCSDIRMFSMDGKRAISREYTFSGYPDLKPWLLHEKVGDEIKSKKLPLVAEKVTLSNSGKWALEAYADRLLVWRLDDLSVAGGLSINFPSGHDMTVPVFSANDEFILTRRSNNIVDVWRLSDLTSGKEKVSSIFKLQTEEDVSFDRSGENIVYSTPEGNVGCFSIGNQVLLKSANINPYNKGKEVSPYGDGNRWRYTQNDKVVIEYPGGDKNIKVMPWSMATEDVSLVEHSRMVIPGKFKHALSMECSPGGTLAIKYSFQASPEDMTCAMLLDIMTSRPKPWATLFPPEVLRDVEISPNGKFVAILDQSNNLRINYADKRRFGRLLKEGASRVTAVAYHADELEILAEGLTEEDLKIFMNGGASKEKNASKVRFFEKRGVCFAPTRAGDYDYVHPSAESYVEERRSENGMSIAPESVREDHYDSKPLFLIKKGGAPMPLVGMVDDVVMGKLNPAGTRLLTVEARANNAAFSTRPCVRLWNTATMQQIGDAWTMLDIYGEPVVIRDLVLSPDGRRACTLTFEGWARIWDVETGIAMSGLLSEVHMAVFNEDSSKIALINQDDTIDEITISPGAQSTEMLLKFMRSVDSHDWAKVRKEFSGSTSGRSPAGNNPVAQMIKWALE